VQEKYSEEGMNGTLLKTQLIPKQFMNLTVDAARISGSKKQRT
jgi:hypothetical protein